MSDGVAEGGLQSGILRVYKLPPSPPPLRLVAVASLDISIYDSRKCMLGAETQRGQDDTISCLPGCQADDALVDAPLGEPG